MDSIMGNNLPKYTMNDINNMITAGKIIFIVNGKVVDATDMAKKHPAGERCLLRNNGKNCTQDYDFHSCGAKKMWDERVIGKLDI